MKKIVFRVLIGLVIFCGVCGIAGVSYIGVQISHAPKVESIDATPDGYLTVILDGKGEKVNSLYMTDSNRVYVRLEDTPEYLQNAFVAIEDSRFYRHHGIDWKGILRAAVKGVAKGFHFSEGASTITQQLLKNNVFVGWMREDSFKARLDRKIQEQYLATALEKEHTKQWILENYMNTINLGGGTRGVQVAAQYYFGVDVSDLTLGQAALIAGITKNPTGYNPLKHPDRSLERQHLVLNAMLRDEYITEEECEQAKTEDVIGELLRDHEQVQIFNWFEDALLNNIVRDLGATYHYSEEEAWDLIYCGGLTIYSTMDRDLQSMCENEVRNGEYEAEDEEISVVITDVSTGAVAAIVGGREEKNASLVYDRAIEAVRQPGSCIKVLGEYAAALDQGMITLGTVMDDEPFQYSDGTTIHNSSRTYGGMTTIRDAIADSNNVLALKTYRQVGQDSVMDYLRSFGITTLTEKDANEALAIGGTYNGVTNLELTAAYNTIAAGGIYRKPHYYSKVLDHQGDVLLAYDAKELQTIHKTTADLLTLAMEAVMTEGTGAAAAPENVETAGKSGTTNNNKDLWFVGYSPWYTCGVWGGRDNYGEQKNRGNIKLLWKNLMEKAHENIPEANQRKLVETDDYVQVEICRKCGNLALESLCGHTVQGSRITTEYYLEGTEPTEYCDCHVQIRICSESGKPAGVYCPYTKRQNKVFLKTATKGTTDVEYSAESLTGQACDVHTNFWQFFGGKAPSEEETPETRPEQKPEQGHSSGDENHKGDFLEELTDWFGDWFR